MPVAQTAGGINYKYHLLSFREPAPPLDYISFPRLTESLSLDFQSDEIHVGCEAGTTGDCKVMVLLRVLSDSHSELGLPDRDEAPGNPEHIQGWGAVKPEDHEGLWSLCLSPRFSLGNKRLFVSLCQGQRWKNKQSWERRSMCSCGSRAKFKLGRGVGI